MAPTVVLITGANRGLGVELALRYLAEPDHIVIAAIRNPSEARTARLSSAPKGQGTKLVVVDYDAAVEQSPFDAVESLKADHGIDHLDMVIANAAISKEFPLVKDARPDSILEHYTVNVVSIVSLYQATRPLLKRAWELSRPRTPVFAIMGSVAGTMGRQPLVPSGVYGASKAAAHWYAVRINNEDEWLSCPVIDPGFVQTDMGDYAAEVWGVGRPPTTVEESCDGMFVVLNDPDSKSKFGGKMVLYTGEIQIW
ncbi:hypothetical protein MAPG_06172 [Magnaporthiopsis poae ATCC 64411]|uniref:Aflatoxin biosynthesis ketoreductase nor-1 n=1 Tax=Magnaporthiopsis poae (strain ATCC 64411 / 73-15) TaxID=644358 RepID=A0A0C4E1B4_MAGP6|nr:hypothetical protein MAPG_06172 [Magnaporthiopsis poae ATCC 64411]